MTYLGSSVSRWHNICLEDVTFSARIWSRKERDRPLEQHCPPIGQHPPDEHATQPIRHEDCLTSNKPRRTPPLRSSLLVASLLLRSGFNGASGVTTAKSPPGMLPSSIAAAHALTTRQKAMMSRTPESCIGRTSRQNGVLSTRHVHLLF